MSVEILQPGQGQQARSQKAAAVTSYQVKLALQIAQENNLSAPEVLGSIIEALAMNYRASIAASKD